MFNGISVAGSPGYGVGATVGYVELVSSVASRCFGYVGRVVGVWVMGFSSVGVPGVFDVLPVGLMEELCSAVVGVFIFADERGDFVRCHIAACSSEIQHSGGISGSPGLYFLVSSPCEGLMALMPSLGSSTAYTASV